MDAVFASNEHNRSRPQKRGGMAQWFSGYFFGFSPLILAVLFIWPFGGGGKKVEMMAGAENPAARGQVTAKPGDNGNRDLDIKVHSMAQPNSLTPPANVYLVWLQEPGRDPRNLGQIQIDDKQKGELQVITPFARFKLFITAEQNAQEHTPLGPTVLSADIPAS